MDKGYKHVFCKLPFTSLTLNLGELKLLYCDEEGFNILPKQAIASPTEQCASLMQDDQIGMHMTRKFTLSFYISKINMCLFPSALPTYEPIY